jgi:O-phosphoseryl-tRNA(Cys) synthetase
MNIGQFHEALASDHPFCMGIHWDHKKHMTISDLSALHDAGFKDCSWGNDECPSYYIPDTDDTHLYAYCDDCENGDAITYSISHNSRPCMDTYTNITDAIREYKRITK